MHCPKNLLWLQVSRKGAITGLCIALRPQPEFQFLNAKQIFGKMALKEVKKLRIVLWVQSEQEYTAISYVKYSQTSLDGAVSNW